MNVPSEIISSHWGLGAVWKYLVRTREGGKSCFNGAMN